MCDLQSFACRRHSAHGRSRSLLSAGIMETIRALESCGNLGTLPIFPPRSVVLRVRPGLRGQIARSGKSGTVTLYLPFPRVLSLRQPCCRPTGRGRTRRARNASTLLMKPSLARGRLVCVRIRSSRTISSSSVSVGTSRVPCRVFPRVPGVYDTFSVRALIPKEMRGPTESWSSHRHRSLSSGGRRFRRCTRGFRCR